MMAKIIKVNLALEILKLRLNATMAKLPICLFFNCVKHFFPEQR